MIEKEAAGKECSNGGFVIPPWEWKVVRTVILFPEWVMEIWRTEFLLPHVRV